MPRLIALLTDFGTADAYAGVLKGVIASRLPEARMLDLTHGIPPQDVQAGALRLAAAAPFLPPDTVFLAVVDPGVGGERRPLILRSGDRCFVGPDNGLMWHAASSDGPPEAWTPDRPEFWLPTVSATFHGRDLFAPVAAALAAGTPPEALASPVADPVRWSPPPPVWTATGVTGEVLLVDGYGNAITNLRPVDCGDPPDYRVTFAAGGHAVRGPAPYYAAAPKGSPVVVCGSYGTFEIAVNGGNAAAQLGLAVGTPVVVQR
jgi:S-adenosylmethionine hydrolase